MNKKKDYLAPEIRVHMMEQTKVVCTSSVNATDNESYEEGETSGWY